MRSDIQKVICTRARYNDHFCIGSKATRVGKTKNGRRGCRMSRQLRFVVDDETGELDELSPVARPMSRHAREFSDFLAPLEGWIAAQVGRPYDKVFSELAAQLKGNGVLQQHVKGHAEDYLIAPDKVVFVDGVACDASLEYQCYGDRHHQPLGANVVYGDPRDGIVKWGTGPSRRGMLGRYNPKAQQQCYMKLPTTEGAKVPVKSQFSGAGTLFKRGGRWWFTYQVEVPNPDWHFFSNRWVPQRYYVEKEGLASNKLIKSFGYRPEKTRRR